MTKPDKTRHSLSTEQLNAIDLLVTGKRDREVAEAIGVSRQTVCGWRQRNAHFQAELNRRRNEIWGASVDQLRSLLPQAVAVVARALESGEKELVAALKVLEMAGFTARTRDLSSIGVGSEDPEEIRAIMEAAARLRRENLDDWRAARTEEREDRRRWAGYKAESTRASKRGRAS